MRQIIIQQRINIPSDFSFQYVFWAVVPAARQIFYANASFTTVVKDATAPEIAALQAGSVVEQVNQGNYQAGTPIATIQTDLITKYNAYQAQITAINPWIYYGTYWDGTWHVTQTA
jgi:hypothetical protein